MTLAAVLSSATRSDLENVESPQVQLAIWERAIMPCLQQNLRQAMPTFPVALRYRVDVLKLGLVGSRLSEFGGLALGRDVVDLGRWFAKLTATRDLAVRFEVVTGNACRKFHADYKTRRLITTYVGPGTEWIYADDPDNISALPPGAVGLFKGRLGLGEQDVKILHRSPQIAGQGKARLLLVIDSASDSDEDVEVLE